MENNELNYPDINESVIINKDHNAIINEFGDLINGDKSYRYYIANIDLYVPNSLKFIPITYKKEGSKSCYYSTGLLRNQSYGSVDIQEAIKVGCKVMKLYSAVCYPKTIKFPYIDYIKSNIKLRSAAKKNNDDVLSDLYKLLCNSLYGKMVCKDITESFIFTT